MRASRQVQWKADVPMGPGSGVILLTTTLSANETVAYSAGLGFERTKATPELAYFAVASMFIEHAGKRGQTVDRLYLAEAMVSGSQTDDPLVEIRKDGEGVVAPVRSGMAQDWISREGGSSASSNLPIARPLKVVVSVAYAVPEGLPNPPMLHLAFNATGPAAVLSPTLTERHEGPEFAGLLRYGHGDFAEVDEVVQVGPIKYSQDQAAHATVVTKANTWLLWNVAKSGRGDLSLHWRGPRGPGTWDADPLAEHASKRGSSVSCEGETWEFRLHHQVVGEINFGLFYADLPTARLPAYVFDPRAPLEETSACV